MYLVRAQLYWSVCNRIRWTKHRDEVAGGGWRGIGGKPSFGGYLQSPRLVSPCFRTPCIVKYYRQEKTNKSLPPQKNLDFSCLLVVTLRPELVLLGCAEWTELTARPLLQLIPVAPCCQRSLLEGLCKVPLLCQNEPSDLFCSNICVILLGNEGSGSTVTSQRPWP